MRISYNNKVAQEEQAQTTYENSATARRVTLVNASGENISNADPLPVNLVSASLKTTAIEFQEDTSVPGSTVTTVLSFTNSSGSTIMIDAIGGSGQARSEWTVQINTSTILKRRSGVSNMNIEIPMHEFKLADGDIIDIKVEHYESSSLSFNAEVHYYQ